jgi:hypothetical protein
VADAKVSSAVFPALFPTPQSNPGQSFLHLAIIQLPIRRWQRPWQHQRAIALFATSPEGLKLRLQREGRLRAGEQILRIIEAGAR